MAGALARALQDRSRVIQVSGKEVVYNCSFFVVCLCFQMKKKKITMKMTTVMSGMTK